MNNEPILRFFSWVRRAQLNRPALLLIPVSLLFTPRVNVYVIALYVLAVLAQPNPADRFWKALHSRWVIAFLVLYGLHLWSLLWTENQALGWFILEKKSSLLVLPWAIAADRQLDRKMLRQVQTGFIAGAVGLVLICLAMAAWRYLSNGDRYTFFYHDLGMPFDLNAVYFSLYVFTAIVFLDDAGRQAGAAVSGWRMWAAGLVATLLAAALFLLASRLFLFLLGIMLAIRLWRQARFRRWPSLIALLGGIVLLLSLFRWLDVPRLRFEDIFHSRLEVVTQDRYEWKTRFNGLTLRLLFLRFGGELLRDEEAYLTGVGVGDAQPTLNEVMKRYGVYLGNPQLGDTGYLNYNFHNQYLELWVQAGPAALLVFFTILGSALRLGWKTGWSTALWYIAVALTAFALTECFLERQRGVVFFAFFLSVFQALRKDEKD